MQLKTEQEPLRLDEATHTYYKGRRVIPGNTEIIKAAGLYGYMDAIPKDKLEFARDRGTAVHSTVELYLKGTLEMAHPIIEPYLDQFKKFVAETGLHMELSEQVLYCDFQGVEFGTKIDIVARLLNRSETDRYLIELKTSDAQSDISRLQTAAQYRALMQTEDADPFLPYNMRRGVLVVTDTGYHFEEHPTEEQFYDWSCFAACYQIYKWKKFRGLI